MNDTQDPPEGDTRSATSSTEAGDGTFEPSRLRTIADATRPADDRLVAGVSTGLARHLDVDPVLVRILFGVLTFVGGAGVILYAAAWFLLPPDDTGTSVAADWFKLDDNEEKVRKGGLVIAAVVAVLAVVGESSWGGGAPWVLLPLALVVYIFAVRPRRRREARLAAAGDDPAAAPHELAAGTTPRAPAIREPRSRALTGLTVSVIAIAVAVTRIVAETHDGTPWTTYVAVSLTVVGAGLLVSAFWGHGGPLIALGVLLSLVLATGSVLPDGRVGDQRVTPETAAEVSTTYEHGVGLLQLDLTSVDDPDALVGRTLELDTGVGQTRVVLPNGLNVRIDAGLSLGQVEVFDRTVSGNDNRIVEAAGSGPALTIDIDQKVGNIEVIRK